MISLEIGSRPRLEKDREISLAKRSPDEVDAHQDHVIGSRAFAPEKVADRITEGRIVSTDLELGIERDLSRSFSSLGLDSPDDPINDSPMMDTTHAATLRGLGRYGYRSGRSVHHTIQDAIEAINRDLSESERMIVMAGWRDERSES